MSTSEPQQPPPAMPTPEDAMAILARAQEAAQRAESAAERMSAARTAATQETQERFPGIPDDLVKQIADSAADSVLSALRKEFELSPPTGGSAGGEPTSEPSPSSSTSGSDSPASSTATSSPSPARPTIAQRILGG